MKGKIISEEIIERFKNYLCEEEKSENTKEKYIRDIKAFTEYVGGKEITNETVIAYKQSLIDSGYAVKSINSMLASINSLLSFLGWYELRVKSLKVQQQIFCPEEKELTRAEYERLCQTAERKHNERLNLILQTILSIIKTALILFHSLALILLPYPKQSRLSKEAPLVFALNRWG